MQTTAENESGNFLRTNFLLVTEAEKDFRPRKHISIFFPPLGDKKRWHGSTWALRVATRDLETLARQVTLMGEFFSLGVR